MKYFSMFSGIGGFELGINQAFQRQTRVQPERQVDVLQPRGDSTNSDISLWNGGRTRPVCVGYSEIDKYAIKVYERNFSGHRNYGDATAINPTDLPDFDLLVGGFPCQAFSVAGKRAGFNDTRGTLFFDIARILKEKQPRHLVLENVKGLLSHDSGRTFTTIIGVLTDLGYLVEWQVLNSKNFGVPQNRERVYIVGHLGNECGRKVFPITGNGGQANGVQRHISNTLTARYEGAQATGTYIANTISTGSTHTVGTYVGQGELDAQEAEPSRQDIQQERNQPNDSDIRGGETYPERVRRLTPTECERLQGFPDNWTKYGVKKVLMQQSEERPFPKNGTLTELEETSDTQRYKMCGNAVTVNTVQAVMERLIPCLTT
jgi:DNA (cytosine-5)-methyltransferase 1